MPTAAEFDAWTAEDEEKALAVASDGMKVKHIIKDDSVWFLAPRGHLYKLPLALSIDDFVKLSDIQSDAEQIQTLKRILEAFAGRKAAEQLASEPFIIPMNILQDYGAIMAKVQGAELGKLQASAESFKAPTETR